jgi:hypothetical protein
MYTASTSVAMPKLRPALTGLMPPPLPILTLVNWLAAIHHDQFERFVAGGR